MATSPVTKPGLNTGSDKRETWLLARQPRGNSHGKAIFLSRGIPQKYSLNVRQLSRKPFPDQCEFGLVDDDQPLSGGNNRKHNPENLLLQKLSLIHI